MNTAALLTALLTYGPSIIPLVGKLVTDIESGKGRKEVTAADLAELARLASLSSTEIYARLGIAPPPPVDRLINSAQATPAK
jgi:hypothetical protein